MTFCSHKFVDSKNCLKCGVHIDELRAAHAAELASYKVVSPASTCVGAVGGAGGHAPVSIRCERCNWHLLYPLPLGSMPPYCPKCAPPASVEAAVETPRLEVPAQVRLAVEHLMAELLDEMVPAGELVRLAASVRQSVKEEAELFSAGPAVLGTLARELAAELLGDNG